MFSIKKMRELISDRGAEFTDEELIGVRDNLYGLAELALEDWLKKKQQGFKTKNQLS